MPTSCLRWLSAPVLAWILGTGLPASGQDQQPDKAQSAFVAEIEALDTRFSRAKEEGSRLNEAGRVKEGTAHLLGLLPSARQTPAFHFWLGNLLFDLDPEQARILHGKAFEALPTQPLVQFEWAVEEHRSGHHQQAAALYERCLGPESDARYALLADCYLHLGAVDKASKAWKQADHPHHHTGIDQAIYWIYGKPSPYRRRSDLLTQAASDPSVWESIVKLDATWDSDWWNQEARPDLLKVDLAKAKAALGNGPSYLELETFAELLQHRPDTTQLKELLRSRNWILDGKGLPLSTRLGTRLLEHAVSLELVTPKVLLDRFREDLWARARRQGAGDLDALHILASLSLSQNLDITEIDRFGWEQGADPSFALSFLMGRGEALRPGDTELQKALRQFPSDARLARLAVESSLRAKQSITGPLIHLIQAEFAGLATDPNRYSYALKGYFQALQNVP